MGISFLRVYFWRSRAVVTMAASADSGEKLGVPVEEAKSPMPPALKVRSDVFSEFLI